MVDRPQPSGPPLHTFSGAAGTAGVWRVKGSSGKEGFEVRLNGSFVGEYPNKTLAFSVAEDVASRGLEGLPDADPDPLSEPEATPDPSPGPRGFGA